jgi:hypothetical protein
MYLGIIAINSFFKGLNFINILRALNEENRIDVKDKELGFVITNLVVSLFSTLATLLNISMFII